MKIFKKTLAALSAAAMLCGASVPVSAAGSFDDPDAIFSAKTEDCCVSYKANMIYGDIVERYSVNNCFGDVFSDEYRIFGQYKDSINGNCLITFAEKDGIWKTMGAMALEDYENVIDFESEAEKIKRSQNGSVFDTVIGKAVDYNLYLIYYKTAEDEFVVPYDDVECAFMKNGIWNYGYIESGKTYTADEFVGILKKYQSRYEGVLMGDANGDNKVNVRDCSYMAHEISMWPFYAEEGRIPEFDPAFDYDKDGNMSIRDAARLSRDLAAK